MRRTLIWAALVLASVPSAPAIHSVTSCSHQLQAAVGSCAAFANDGSTLNVSATRETSDSDPGSDNNDSNTDSPDSDGPSGGGGPSERAKALAKCMDASGTLRCADLLRPDVPATPPPGIPAITMSDLAQFAPAAAVTSAEPGNVGVAGLPINVLAAASAQTVSGSLFGAPVTVRFTPIAYEFAYGDGSTATLDSPGRTWASLGQVQFSPTATSHVYRARGAYPAKVDVRYSAEVDLGAGWLPVEGELRTDGSVQQIRIFEAHTALVAHTCEERPKAPGC